MRQKLSCVLKVQFSARKVSLSWVKEDCACVCLLQSQLLPKLLVVLLLAHAAPSFADSGTSVSSMHAPQ